MTWTALGESVAGTSHRAQNAPCQDAFRFRTCGSDGTWLLVAVADGAGSSSHGELGASLVCDEFVRRVEADGPSALCTRDGIGALFRGTRDALVVAAQERGVALRELACTALLGLVGPETAGFGQVGDGAIVIGSEPNYRTVFWPEPAGYANATDFLTDERYAVALRIETTAEPIAEVAVLSDGLQRLALDFAARTPFPDFFLPLFRRLRADPDTESLYEPFRSFLDSPRINARTDDDKTLVLAVRRA